MALEQDKAPSKALSFNEFGLVCITRKRTKQALERVLCQPCPYCTGSGMVNPSPRSATKSRPKRARWPPPNTKARISPFAFIPKSQRLSKHASPCSWTNSSKPLTNTSSSNPTPRSTGNSTTSTNPAQFPSFPRRGTACCAPFLFSLSPIPEFIPVSYSDSSPRRFFRSKPKTICNLGLLTSR